MSGREGMCGVELPGFRLLQGGFGEEPAVCTFVCGQGLLRECRMGHSQEV